MGSKHVNPEALSLIRTRSEVRLFVRPLTKPCVTKSYARLLLCLYGGGRLRCHAGAMTRRKKRGMENGLPRSAAGAVGGSLMPPRWSPSRQPKRRPPAPPRVLILVLAWGRQVLGIEGHGLPVEGPAGLAAAWGPPSHPSCRRRLFPPPPARAALFARGLPVSLPPHRTTGHT